MDPESQDGWVVFRRKGGKLERGGRFWEGCSGPRGVGLCRRSNPLMQNQAKCCSLFWLMFERCHQQPKWLFKFWLLSCFCCIFTGVTKRFRSLSEIGSEILLWLVFGCLC